MSQTPFISVIVPIYNVERYAQNCIDSILNQTFKSFEVIIIADNFPNEFFDNVHGEYLLFVDGDTVLLHNALGKIFNALQIYGEVDAIHFKGHYETFQNDDNAIDVKNLKLSWEVNGNEGLLTEDIPRRLSENWLNNPIVDLFGATCLKRKIFEKNYSKLPSTSFRVEAKLFNLAAMCFAKKYLSIRDAVYVKRILQRQPNILEAINAMPTVTKCVEEILNKVPAIEHNRAFKDQCLMEILDNLSTNNILPFYANTNIPPELDQAVYQILLPTFKENTALMKYFFQGFNVMRRQNYFFAMQNNLLVNRINQLNQLVSLYENENFNLNNLLNEVDRAKENIRNPFESLCGASYEYLENLSQILPRRKFAPKIKSKWLSSRTTRLCGAVMIYIICLTKIPDMK